MKRKSLIIVLFIVFITLSFSSFAYDRVKYAVDGDTVLMETGRPVRYLGIDAPELGRDGREDEFLAREARDYNRSLVQGGRVRLEFDLDRVDRHGRLLAYLFTEKGVMINALMIRKGFARVMATGPNLKYFSLLRDHQRLAMSEKIGLWGQKPAREEAYYLGNARSYRFHRPSCPFAKRTSQRFLIRFENTHAAHWEGFSPCRQCKP